METARGLGELLKSGWRPKRTIILASWDGEEWGLLGSTEWAEKHAQELSTKAVAYINSDSTSKGWLDVSGSHSLQAFVNDVMRDIPDPKREDKTPLRREAWIARSSQAKTDDEKGDHRAAAGLPDRGARVGIGLHRVPRSPDHRVAQHGLRRRRRRTRGVYHSTYDSFYWYTHFSDTDFAYGAALSRTIGTAILRLADADILPFEFTATAATLRGYANEIDKLRKDTKDAPPLEMTLVLAAVERLAKAADTYERASAQFAASGAALDRAKQVELNRLLYTSERAFKYDAGLPKRDWFKHLAYAPGFYTGYGVKTLPGIREGIEQKAWDEPKKYIPIVVAAIDKLAAQVEQGGIPDRLDIADRDRAGSDQGSGIGIAAGAAQRCRRRAAAAPGPAASPRFSAGQPHRLLDGDELDRARRLSLLHVRDRAVHQELGAGHLLDAALVVHARRRIEGLLPIRGRIVERQRTAVGRREMDHAPLEHDAPVVQQQHRPAVELPFQLAGRRTAPAVGVADGRSAR